MTREDWRHAALFAIGVFAGMFLIAATIDPMAGALFVVLYYVAYWRHYRLTRSKERAANGKGKGQ